MGLNEGDLLRMLQDYQGKFSKLETEFCKFKSDLHISSNVNDKLFDKLVVLERKYDANKQYSWRKTFEIFSILLKRGIMTLKKSAGNSGSNGRSWIWLRTTIVYPQKVPQKRYIKTRKSKSN